MGYGDGKQAIARWREKEVEVLNEICRSHGIEPLSPEKSQSELDAFNGELKSATEKKVKMTVLKQKSPDSVRKFLFQRRIFRTYQTLRKNKLQA